VPFDPVSFFLLHGWQIINKWTRAETLCHLAKKRTVDYEECYGFAEGIYPTGGGGIYCFEYRLALSFRIDIRETGHHGCIWPGAGLCYANPQAVARAGIHSRISAPYWTEWTVCAILYLH
jgi:hypothetical protein